MKKRLGAVLIMLIVVLPFGSGRAGATRPLYSRPAVKGVLTLPPGTKPPFSLIGGGFGVHYGYKGSFYSTKKVNFILGILPTANTKLDDIGMAAVVIVSNSTGKAVLFGSDAILSGADLSHAVMPQATYVLGTSLQDLGTISGVSCTLGCSMFLDTDNVAAFVNANLVPH